MSQDYEPIRMHLESVSERAAAALPKTAAGRKRKQLVTTYSTVKVTSGNTTEPQPVLAASDQRVLAIITPHTPGGTDTYTSSGWIGDQGQVRKQGGTYVVAGGQGPTYVIGGNAVWCTTDPASSTDLWLSVIDTTEVG